MSHRYQAPSNHRRKIVIGAALLALFLLCGIAADFFLFSGKGPGNQNKGPFVSMPSTKGGDGKYHDICCPTTKEMREALHSAILGAYQKEVTQERPSVRAAIKENAAEAASRPVPDQQKQRAADKGER